MKQILLPACSACLGLLVYGHHTYASAVHPFLNSLITAIEICLLLLIALQIYRLPDLQQKIVQTVILFVLLLITFSLIR